MAKPTITDPAVIAAMIEQLGGKVIPGETMRFSVPMRDMPKIVKPLNDVGIGCRKVSEKTECDWRGPHNAVVIACTKTPSDQASAANDANSTLSRFGF